MTHYKIYSIPLIITTLIINQPLLVAQTTPNPEQIYQESIELLKKPNPTNLNQALNQLSTALTLYQAAANQAGQAKTLYNIGFIYESLYQKEKALEYYLRAIPLYQATSNQRGQANSFGRIGSIYYLLGDRIKSIEFYNRSLQLYQQLTDQKQQAIILTNLGLVNRAINNIPAALNNYNQALLIYQQIKDPSGLAMTLDHLGVLYYNQAQLDQALAYYNRSLELNQVTQNRSRQASTLNNIALVYDFQGDKTKALQYYQQALTIHQAINNQSGIATTLTSLGLLYDSIGEKQKALDNYNKSLPIFQEIKDKQGQAATLNNIALTYQSIGEYQKALDYYNQSLPIFQSIFDISSTATVLNGIGLIHHFLQKTDQSLEYYKKTLALLANAKKPYIEAVTLNNIGLAYNFLKQDQTALEYHQRALKLYREVGHKQGEGTSLNNLGATYQAIGDRQLALQHYNQALDIRQAVGHREGEANTYHSVAYLYYQEKNYQASLNNLQKALDIVEELRLKIGDSQLRMTYFTKQQNIYDSYIRLLMKLHQQSPNSNYDQQALEISEKSRARTLLELLNEAKAKITNNVSPEILAKEQQIQTKINTLEKQRLKQINPTPEALENFLKREKQLLEEYQKLRTEIRTKNPKYANLKHPQPLKAKEIQQLLDSDTVILQYSLQETESYLWLITPNQIITYLLPAQTEIENSANEFRQILTRPTQRNRLPLIQKKSQELTQKILQPVLPNIANKRLIIVPDGILQYIPFAALTIDNQPLIQKHELIILPSSSTLDSLRSQQINRPQPPKAIAIIADPVFNFEDNRINPTKVATVRSDNIELRALNVNWSRLPGTKQEAENILKLIPPDQTYVKFGFQANRNSILNPALSEYRYIHIATHGFVNTDKPELSGLIMSLIDESGNPDNGYIRLNDLFNLNLNADLAVLSACQTGLGKIVKGEGIVGLTRGLMYSGSQRVIVSLWQVDDIATSQLMKKLYQEIIINKLSPATALRKAQLELMKEYPSPYYWSAFILQGEYR